MKCNICGKEVVLIPSAKERAEKYGNTPSFYTKLFPTHAQCALDKREADTLKLIHSMKGAQS